MPQDQESNSVKKQKFSWKKVKIFSTYAEANETRKKLKKEGKDHLKIRRCGPGGTSFKLLTGLKLKNQKDKKVNTNESNT